MKSADLPLATLDQIACFETLRIYGRQIFGLDEHLIRLHDSCRAIGKTLNLSVSELKKWCCETLKNSGFADSLFRLSVHWENEKKGHLVAIIKEFEPYPPEFYEKGICIQTAVQRRWTLRAQDAQTKTSQFMNGVLAVLDRGEKAVNELIFLAQTGFVTEGTVSNIFILASSYGRVKEKRLLTPSVSSGILRGVTRASAIELAEKRGWKCAETYLTRHEIYNAQECFLTSTLSEILPVVKVDGRQIGSGKPGIVTQTLLKDFKYLCTTGVRNGENDQD